MTSRLITATIGGTPRVVDLAARTKPRPFGAGPMNLTGYATYYVDSVAGSNGNSGLTPSTPKQTLAALPTLTEGAIVALKCGSTFREAIPMTGSGTATAPIIWGQYGTGTRPKIKGSKDYGTTLTWSLSSGVIYSAPAAALPAAANLVYVDEVTPLRKYASLAALQAGTAGGYFADTTNNVLYVWMWDGSNPTGHAVEVNGVVTQIGNTGTRAHLQFQDIAIMHGSGSNAGLFSASTSPGVVIRRCQLGPHYGAGTYVGSPGMIVEDCYVTTCWDAIEYPDTTGSGAGITGGTANSAGAIIRRNWVTGCTHGIRPNAMQTTDIHHNFVYLNHVNGIDNYAAGTAVRVVNNTVWHRPTGPTPAGHGIDQQATGTGLWSRNNLVYTDFTGDSTNVEAYTLASGSGANTSEDYNLGWVAPGSTAAFGKVGTTAYPTAAAYWAAVGAAYNASDNVHSVNVDPLLADLAGLDPRLLAGSPAINAGVVVAGITDGHSGAAPDLGAFEHVG